MRQKKNLLIPYEPEALPSQLAEEPAPEEEHWQQLISAIEKLNEDEKAIVMLYLEDRSYEEMEDILGLGQGALRVKMSRIKDKLRKLTKND